MIEKGIPAREYVPGALGLLPKAKRLHIAAQKKTGKSLVFGVVVPLHVVAAGGTVAILDRENGAEEYARRLEAVLGARGADAGFKETARQGYHYHAWPAMRLNWGSDRGYPDAFADTDLVVFDSSRPHLTPLGLKEDLSDDYAEFTAALVDPLMRAGKTVIVLDNTGHAEKGRARGTSAKEDLADIAFTMKTITPFSANSAGRVKLRCTASRLGEFTAGATWQMQLGGGHYGAWERIGARPPAERDDLHEAVAGVLIAAADPMGVERIGRAIRDRPGNSLHFAAETLRSALAEWASDPTSGIIAGHDGVGYTVHVGRPRHGGQVGEAATRRETTSDDEGESRAAVEDLPVSGSGDMGRHGGHVAVVAPVRGDTADAGADTDDGELPDGYTEEYLPDCLTSTFPGSSSYQRTTLPAPPAIACCVQTASAPPAPGSAGATACVGRGPGVPSPESTGRPWIVAEGAIVPGAAAAVIGRETSVAAANASAADDTLPTAIALVVRQRKIILRFILVACRPPGTARPDRITRPVQPARPQGHKATRPQGYSRSD
jgi:hypothetical protein